MVTVRQGVLALVTWALLPSASARAELLVTPFLGKAGRGSLDEKRTTYGGAVAFLGGGVVGVEAELSYIKEFFGPSTTVGSADSNRMQGLSGNVILAMPSGSARLYATGGLSLLRPALKDRAGFVVIDEDKLGFNAGGGLFLATSNHAAIRGDLRYFRAFGDLQPGTAIGLGTLDYWRGSIGITLRF